MDFLLIFLAKIVEVSLMTIRMVFVTKGEKLYASIIGFIEVSIWLRIVSVVLVGISEDPTKMFAYSLGFACGSYIGLTLEEKIGLGFLSLQIIVDLENGQNLADLLRNEGKAVTILEAEGRDSKKVVLLVHIKRKDKASIMDVLSKHQISSVVTVSEMKKIYGGFGIRK